MLSVPIVETAQHGVYVMYKQFDWEAINVNVSVSREFM